MKEDDLLIRPKAPWYERIRWQTWISVISLVIAVLSMLFAWQLVRVGNRQAKAAEHQAATADQALTDAKQASRDQKSDVERARLAAEKSRDSAAELADANETIAGTQNRSLGLAEQQFSAFRRAVHSGMQPLLYDANATVSGDFVSFTIANKGRMAAEIGKVWCGAGVFVRPGSADVLKLLDASPEVFRRSTIVPDQQERIELPVFASMPAFLTARNPFLASMKQPLIWLVVCDMPYSDELDDPKAPPPHDLRFCYEIQPGSAGRQAVMCPTDQISSSIKKLTTPSLPGLPSAGH